MEIAELTAWLEQNPLRKFRKKNKLGLMEIAGLLGVGVSTVQTWEKGVTVPKSEKFKMLANLLNAPDIEETWFKWLENKPKI